MAKTMTKSRTDNDGITRRLFGDGTYDRLDDSVIHRANRMSLVPFEDWLLLWGYGWALYAAKHVPTDSVFIYNGWYGHSQTTSCHMSKLQSQAEKHEEYAAFTGIKLVEGAKPSLDYGKLTTDREELSDLKDRHVPAPNGYSGR